MILNIDRKTFYINKQSIPRTVVDVLETFYFDKNYYTDKNKDNGFLPIDELFSFEKHKHMDKL